MTEYHGVCESYIEEWKLTLRIGFTTPDDRSKWFGQPTITSVHLGEYDITEMVCYRGARDRLVYWYVLKHLEGLYREHLRKEKGYD